MSERMNEVDHADIADLGKVLNVLNHASGGVRRELTRRKEAVRLEMRQRLTVSDHAIVRYLERVCSFDVEKLRVEIGDIADAGIRFKHIDDAVWHPEKKLVLIIDEGMVVTILSEEQSDKYLGRSLMNGMRAGGEQEAIS